MKFLHDGKLLGKPLNQSTEAYLCRRGLQYLSTSTVGFGGGRGSREGDNNKGWGRRKKNKVKRKKK